MDIALVASGRGPVEGAAMDLRDLPCARASGAGRVVRQGPPVKVSRVRVHPAPSIERDGGLLAWLTIEVAGLALDGFALRRTREGRPYVSFPKRKDAAGRLHPLVWPLDQRDRQSLQDQVLAAIDTRGLLQ